MSAEPVCGGEMAKALEVEISLLADSRRPTTPPTRTGSAQVNEPSDDIDWNLTTWEGSRREQLRRWRALTVRERLVALDEVANWARRFADMRAEGRFHDRTRTVASLGGAPPWRMSSARSKRCMILLNNWVLWRTTRANERTIRSRDYLRQTAN